MRRGRNVVKGIIMAALSLTMVLASLPAMPTTVMAADHNVTSLNDFESLTDGDTYIFDSSLDGECRIEVGNKNIIIDLNGKTVTATCPSTGAQGAICISNGGSVILNDSVVS